MKLYCVYGIVGDNQVVLELEGDNMVREIKTKAPTWEFGAIRGGVVIPWKGNLLRIFHSRRDGEFSNPRHRYYVGWLVMKKEPPFEILEMCKEPLFAGSELDTLDPMDRNNCLQYKKNVAFPGGAIESNGNILVSVGINDGQCAIVKIPLENL
jgi:predicted GH43/DUF377 family glycosyl hydrolase